MVCRSSPGVDGCVIMLYVEVLILVVNEQAQPVRVCVYLIPKSRISHHVAKDLASSH